MVSRETPLLALAGVSKRFENTVALDDVSLEIESGEVLALLGPSGSGKSTLLRVVAGLTMPDAGHVYLDGKDITRVPPHRRGFGMMFQQFALFPHRSVAENIAFGLEMQGWAHAAITQRVQTMLDLVGMRGYERRTIFELSGGEQQRVALARSLAPEPPLLLLDEPLGSLDRRLRERLVEELREILSHISTTSIYVTHDQQEAFAVSDRLALMAQGRLVQIGPAATVYQHPANRFVAEFFGLQNIVPVQGRHAGPRPGTLRVQTPLGPLTMEEDGRHDGSLLLIRPEAASLTDGTSANNEIQGTVEAWSFRGSHCRLVTRHSEIGRLTWEVRPEEGAHPRVGEPISLWLRENGLAFLSA